MLRYCAFGGLILLMLLMACRNPEKEMPPDDVLSPGDFTQLLFDMHMAETWYTLQKAKGMDPKFLANRLYDSLRLHHDIDRKTIERSFNWYAAHPKLLDKIYDELIHRINQQMLSDTVKDNTNNLTEEMEER